MKVKAGPIPTPCSPFADIAGVCLNHRGDDYVIRRHPSIVRFVLCRSGQRPRLQGGEQKDRNEIVDQVHEASPKERPSQTNKRSRCRQAHTPKSRTLRRCPHRPRKFSQTLRPQPSLQTAISAGSAQNSRMVPERDVGARFFLLPTPHCAAERLRFSRGTDHRGYTIYGLGPDFLGTQPPGYRLKCRMKLADCRNCGEQTAAIEAIGWQRQDFARRIAYVGRRIPETGAISSSR
jgi:hypothetical protein